MPAIQRHNHDFRIRNRLFRQHPYCNWCGRKVVPNLDDRYHPANEATLDHIMDRRQAPSQEVYVSAANTVLSCHRCNQRRSRGQRMEAVVPEWTPLSAAQMMEYDRGWQAAVRVYRISKGGPQFWLRLDDTPSPSFRY